MALPRARDLTLLLENCVLNLKVLLKSWRKNGISVKDVNEHLVRKFGFGIDPAKYGFVTLTEFFEYLSREGDIILENGRVIVKLANNVSNTEKEYFTRTYPENIDKDKKEREISPSLKNEISREIDQLNLQVLL